MKRLLAAAGSIASSRAASSFVRPSSGAARGSRSIPSRSSRAARTRVRAPRARRPASATWRSRRRRRRRWLCSRDPARARAPRARHRACARRGGAMDLASVCPATSRSQTWNGILPSSTQRGNDARPRARLPARRPRIDAPAQARVEAQGHHAESRGGTSRREARAPSRRRAGRATRDPREGDHATTRPRF